MIEEAFIHGHSFLHRLDPRARVVSALGFSLVVALLDRIFALIPACLLAILSVLLARLPLRAVFFRLLMVNGFILFLWIVLPFTFEGKPLFNIGPLVATKEGILYSAILTLKSNGILLIVMSLVATMSIFTLGRASRHLLIPDKLIHLLFFTYRYIHVIHLEYQRLVKAIKIRGFNPGTNMHTYKTYAYLIGMLMLKSHDRAKRVRAAMLCRGFNGTFYDLRTFSMKTSDWVMIMLMFLVLTGIGLLQWTKILY
ncbi:MAG: cobalt ECF transporter T component CbiQ [Pseudomonadota bacterium]